MNTYQPSDNRCPKCGSVHHAEDMRFKRTLLHPIQGVLKTKCKFCKYKWTRKPLGVK